MLRCPTPATLKALTPLPLVTAHRLMQVHPRAARGPVALFYLSFVVPRSIQLGGVSQDVLKGVMVVRRDAVRWGDAGYVRRVGHALRYLPDVMGWDVIDHAKAERRGDPGVIRLVTTATDARALVLWH